ncbi:hypothetical protein Tco_1549184 [Tanacetum coccineum]
MLEDMSLDNEEIRTTFAARRSKVRSSYCIPFLELKSARCTLLYAKDITLDDKHELDEVLQRELYWRKWLIESKDTVIGRVNAEALIGLVHSLTFLHKSCGYCTSSILCSLSRSGTNIYRAKKEKDEAVLTHNLPDITFVMLEDMSEEIGTTFAARRSKRVATESTLTDAQRDEFEDMLCALTLERIRREVEYDAIHKAGDSNESEDNSDESSDDQTSKLKMLQRYLLGLMFGTYSFINVVGGKEEKEDDDRSWRNLVEVAVVMKILHNEKSYPSSSATYLFSNTETSNLQIGFIDFENYQP